MAAALPEITAILREVLRDNSCEVAATTCFEDLPGWDSMDLVAVVVEAECRFNVQFELVEIDRLTTVGDLLRMIAAKQAHFAA
ncbi:acyl carrier protein [Rhodopila sp.]|uniref:acyl carrier protein n=1 Tax=Rhodopila sp. TaxID=2480087 RepID=UPI003D0B7D2A